MNQTAKRILATVLSLLMFISMISVYTFALQYEPDDEYYDRAYNDAVIVNLAWTNLKDGDKVTYTYRGKSITETFDSTIHFSSVSAAYKYCTSDSSAKNDNTVIVLCAGEYTETLDIKSDITILGPNAGIDPNIKGASKSDPWDANPNRNDEAVLRGHIVVDRFLTTNIETTIDGVTLFNNFAYVDRGSKTSVSSVILRNSIINNAGSTINNGKTVKNIFYFDEATTSTNKVTLKNVRASNMNSSSIIGGNTTNIDIDGLCYTNCSYPAINNADANSGQAPVYKIKNSMFYSNAGSGIIIIDHSIKDTASRSRTTLDMTNCVFKDGTMTQSVGASPILYTVISSKNKININNCLFESKKNRTVFPLGLIFTSDSKASTVSDSIKFNSNTLVGFYNITNTTGLAKNSSFDFTGNYFSNVAGNQVDPVYLADASYDNIKMDYFWLDKEMTLKSSIYNITSTGIPNSEIDNSRRIINVFVDYSKDKKFNFTASDPETALSFYEDKELTKKIDEIKISELITGDFANEYYIVATSPKNPSYQRVYTIYISIYNPNQTIDFNDENTYMFCPAVKDLARGSSYYTTWNNTAYRFVVGKNVFATSDEIYKVCGNNPTIIFPAGAINSDFCITKSSILLGAKHGINPNIPQFDTPEVAWKINPLREQSNQETVIQNGVIYISATATNLSVELDGFTFGTKSGFADTGEGLESTTNITIRNTIINDGGGASYNETVAGEVKTRNLTAVFMIGGAKNHKNNFESLSLVNIRMDSQAQYAMISAYCENMLFDGICYTNNGMPMTLNGVTAPEGQNFSVELRNSYIANNSTKVVAFQVDNRTTKTPERSKNDAIFDHNIFYNPSKWPWSAINVMFTSSKDSLYFCNNTVIATDASYANTFSFTSGNSDYFLDDLSKANFTDPTSAEIMRDAVIKFNRFCGAATATSHFNCHPDSKWNYDYNYITKEYNKNTAGGPITPVNPDSENSSENNYYFTDWDMTELAWDKTDFNVSTPDDIYTSELEYGIYGPGKLNKEEKTYTDSVPTEQTTYDFKIESDNKLVKHDIYADSEHTQKLAEPVALDAAVNNFYIVISSYDGKTTDTYTATITKSIGTEAEVKSFGTAIIGNDTINVYTEVGLSTYRFPAIVVSPGAKYAIYDDIAFTKPTNTNGAIRGISATPTYKYMRVTSEDGKKTKDYTISIVQGVNTTAKIIGISGATQISDDKFEASIPGDKALFILTPTLSPNTSLHITNKTKTVVIENGGSTTFNNFSTPFTIDMKAVSSSGETKDYQLIINIDTSACDIESIFNMVEVKDNLIYETATRKTSFDIIPTFKGLGVTYKLYEDIDCTKAISGNTVNLKQRTTTVYMKSTAKDGVTSKVATLVITNLNFAKAAVVHDDKAYFVIKDAQMLSPTHFVLNLDADQTVYKPIWEAVDSRYTTVGRYHIFADPTLKAQIAGYTYLNTDTGEGNNEKEISLATSITTVYFKMSVDRAGVEQIIRLDIHSPRKAVVYSDASSIASWAAKEVNYLNDNGYGYFQGSNGKLNPTSSINRFEISAIAIRLLGIDAEYFITKDIPFTDNIPNWALSSVKACYTLGIMSGVDETTFKGTGATTREQFAKIITSAVLLASGYTESPEAYYNQHKDEIDAKYNAINFADQSSIAAWALPYVKLAVAEFGLINGSSNNNKLYMNPKKAITRQEVAVILANYCGYKK